MSFFIVGLKFKKRFSVHVYSLEFNHADRFPPLTAAAFLNCVKNQRCTVETALLFSYMKLSEGLGAVKLHREGSFLWSGPFQVRVGCDLKGWCHRPDLMSGSATFIPKWRMTEHFMHSTAVNNLQRDTFHLPFESLIHIVWLFFVLTCFCLFTLYCKSFPNCVTYPQNSEKQVKLWACISKQQCILQHHCVEV